MFIRMISRRDGTETLLLQTKEPTYQGHRLADNLTDIPPYAKFKPYSTDNALYYILQRALSRLALWNSIGSPAWPIPLNEMSAMQILSRNSSSHRLNE